MQLRGRRPSRRTLIGAVGALIGLMVWGGCSIEEHYKTLSFFFDGVPDPNAPEGPRRRSSPGPGAGVLRIQSAHSAYENQQCSACHGESLNFGLRVSGFTPIDSKSCLTCHSDALHDKRRIHAPVVTGSCLFCHEAHESVHPNLLNQAAPELCLTCHEGYLRPTPPYHDDLSRSCLDCHWGHGGDDSNFLKPRETWDQAETSGSEDRSVSDEVLERGNAVGSASEPPNGPGIIDRDTSVAPMQRGGPSDAGG